MKKNKKTKIILLSLSILILTFCLVKSTISVFSTYEQLYECFIEFGIRQGIVVLLSLDRYFYAMILPFLDLSIIVFLSICLGMEIRYNSNQKSKNEKIQKRSKSCNLN